MAFASQQNPSMEQQDASTSTNKSIQIPASIVTTQRERGFDLILIPIHEEECRKV